MSSTGVGVTPRRTFGRSRLFACLLPCHHDFHHVSTETFHMIPDLIDSILLLLVLFLFFYAVFSLLVCFRTILYMSLAIWNE